RPFVSPSVAPRPHAQSRPLHAPARPAHTPPRPVASHPLRWFEATHILLLTRKADFQPRSLLATGQPVDIMLEHEPSSAMSKGTLHDRPGHLRLHLAALRARRRTVVPDRGIRGHPRSGRGPVPDLRLRTAGGDVPARAARGGIRAE